MLMTKDIAKLELRDAVSGDEVFIMVQVVNGLTALLLTTRHNGDCEVYLSPDISGQVRASLASAIQIARNQDPQTIEPFATIQEYPDTDLHAVATVSVQAGLVELRLALVGNPDEEYEAGVVLGPDECVPLLLALSEAC